MRACTAAVALILIALLAPAQAHGASIGWDGQGGDSLWHTAANWTTNTVPTIADDVSIAPSTPVAVTVTGADANARSLTSQLDSSTIVVANNRTLTIAGGGQDPNYVIKTVVQNGSTLKILGGRTMLGGFANWTLGDTGGGAGVGRLLLDGTATLDGNVGGQILEAAPGKGLVEVPSGRTATIWNGPTIAASFDNDGTVLMPTGLASAMFIRPGATPASSSSGTWTIGNAASSFQPELVLSPFPGATFTMTGPITGPGRLTVQEPPPFQGMGVVNITSAATFDLGRLQLNNRATLDLDVDGHVDVLGNGSGNFWGLTGDGDLTVDGPGESGIGGRFYGGSTTTFNGPLAMNGGVIDQGSTIRTNAATTWTDGGLTIGNAGGGGTWENAGTLSIQDRGGAFIFPALQTLGNGVLKNLAAGTINKTLTQQMHGNGRIDNAGAINVLVGTMGTAPSQFNPIGPLNQTGGTTTIASGATLERGVAMTGGVLQGAGNVRSVNATGGTVKPGTSPGTLTVLGDYTQSAPATLLAEIAGTSPGTQFDVLNVLGNASLGGTLDIDDTGFTPVDANSFRIIPVAGTTTGTFGTVNGTAIAGGLKYLPDYVASGAGGGVTLCVVPTADTTCTGGTPPPPDADADTIPDADDNCVNVANTDQADNDADGVGNVCDPTPDPTTPDPKPDPKPDPTPTPTATPVATVASTTPAPAPAPPAPPRVAEAQVLTFPSTRRCASRRNFRIRLRTPRGATVRSAAVKVNGKQVQVIRGTRLRAPVDLRTLPKGRFSVEITVTLADGRKVSGTRRYRTCVPKKRS